MKEFCQSNASDLIWNADLLLELCTFQIWSWSIWFRKMVPNRKLRAKSLKTFAALIGLSEEKKQIIDYTLSSQKCLHVSRMSKWIVIGTVLVVKCFAKLKVTVSAICKGPLAWLLFCTEFHLFRDHCTVDLVRVGLPIGGLYFYIQVKNSHCFQNFVHIHHVIQIISLIFRLQAFSI